MRLTACYSADAVKRLSFSPEERQATSGTLYRRPGPISGLFHLLKEITPLAQSVSKALPHPGYKQIEVTGYHGAGATYSQAEYRTRRIEGAADIKRSLIKRIF